MIAKDLDQAFINFDPAQPLPGVSPFYVQRERNPLEKLKRALLRSSPLNQKFLFSGHRGSGKSTEINRLMAYPEIQEKYFIAHYSVKDVLDPAGLEYTDLLFSIGAQIFTKANEKRAKLRSKLLNELDRWREIIEETERGRKVGIETGLDVPLADFFNKAQLRLKLEYESRKKIREKIESRLSELINIIDLIIGEVQLVLETRVLVAIEDLDKTNLDVAKTIFFEKQSSITQPKCTIIYTVPIALFYSPEARQVVQPFTQSYVLPNVTIMNRRDRSPNHEGREVMRKFIEKRMSLDLITEDALEHAVTMSGGVFREMARLMQIAADNAIARGEEKIEKRDVEEAESEIRNEFRRMLETGDYEALVEIHKKRELRGSETCEKLLHNLSILEYQNDESWCDVHPVVVRLIDGDET